MSYVSYEALNKPSLKCCFFPYLWGGKCGDVGWIGIEVTNELDPFTYVPSHTGKISKNSLIKDLKLTL